MVKSYAQALRIQKNRVSNGKHGIAAAITRWIKRTDVHGMGELPYIARVPVFKTTKNGQGEDVREFVRYNFTDRIRVL